MATLGTILYTRKHGSLVGEDTFGNKYYQERTEPEGRRRKRWVVYKGKPEASKVPAEWHAWLHYTADAPIATPALGWIATHVPNLTGTANAYVPMGDERAGGQRVHGTGDYKAWRP
ncbi:MAG: NADH:ubiquinone oxidoreductase subunit NDUFA12 [Rhodospirillaceae bacterium]